RRARNANATWRSRPKSTRPTHIGSSQTCPSRKRDRLRLVAGQLSRENPKRRLREDDLSRRVCLRQGLWTEDLRTPPEQECSNGSLILLAVALWRTFWLRGEQRKPQVHSTSQLLNLNETAESEDSALSRGGRSMRPAGSLHALDKAEGGQAFSNDRA